MTDSGGFLAAQRFAQDSGVVALTSLSSMSFLLPMYVGEVASIEAQVTYARPGGSSIEVLVKVFAENLQDGSRRLTNWARLWYTLVCFNAVQENQVLIPRPLKASVPEVSSDASIERYKALRADRGYDIHGSDSKARQLDGENATAEDRWTARLSSLILPADCYATQFAQGGVVLKLIDSCAGICAAKYCRTNVVTALIEGLHFTRPLFVGNLVEIRARPLFVSGKSLEVEVLVTGENLAKGTKDVSITGRLVFVSLDKDKRPLPIKPLPEPTCRAEEVEREQAALRYAERKRARAARKQSGRSELL
jgi:acyl-coenzyme A thioesterase 7